MAWEYMTLFYDIDSESDGWDKELSDFGSEGWQAVGIAKMVRFATWQLCILLKREVKGGGA